MAWLEDGMKAFNVSSKNYIWVFEDEAQVGLVGATDQNCGHVMDWLPTNMCM